MTEIDVGSIPHADPALLDPETTDSTENLTAEQIAAIEASRPAQDPGTAATPLIREVYATRAHKQFVRPWNQHYDLIYVQTVFNKAMGKNNWIKQWVHYIDGIFLMPYSNSPQYSHDMKWTNRAKNDFESLPLGVANVQSTGIYFIPQDGNLNREIYFWTQVFEGNQMLHQEARPCRWPK